MICLEYAGGRGRWVYEDAYQGYLAAHRHLGRYMGPAYEERHDGKVNTDAENRAELVSLSKEHSNLAYRALSAGRTVHSFSNFMPMMWFGWTGCICIVISFFTSMYGAWLLRGTEQLEMR